MTVAEAPVDRRAVQKANASSLHIQAVGSDPDIHRLYTYAGQLNGCSCGLSVVFEVATARPHRSQAQSCTHPPTTMLRRMTRFMPLDVQIRGSNTSLTLSEALSLVSSMTQGWADPSSPPSVHDAYPTVPARLQPRACAISASV